jgi:hypothetical protein
MVDGIAPVSRVQILLDNPQWQVVITLGSEHVT